MGLETRVGTVVGTGGKLWGWGCCETSLDVHNCVELLAPCDRLFLKLPRVFGDTGGRRGMTGEHGHFGV